MPAWKWWAPLDVSDETRVELLDQARSDGDLRWDDETASASERRIGVMLALIAASRDFQFA